MGRLYSLPPNVVTPCWFSSFQVSLADVDSTIIFVETNGHLRLATSSNTQTRTVSDGSLPQARPRSPLLLLRQLKPRIGDYHISLRPLVQLHDTPCDTGVVVISYVPCRLFRHSRYRNRFGGLALCDAHVREPTLLQAPPGDDDFRGYMDRVLCRKCCQG